MQVSTGSNWGRGYPVYKYSISAKLGSVLHSRRVHMPSKPRLVGSGDI